MIPVIKSNFSMGESIISPKEAINSLIELGYKEAILADTNSVNGLVNATKALPKDKDFKLHIGVTIHCVSDAEYKEPSRNSDEKAIDNDHAWIRLIAKNNEGMKDLFWLLTQAHQEHQFHFTGRASYDQVCEVFSKGNLKLMTGGFDGLFYANKHDELLDKLIESGNTSDILVELHAVEGLLNHTMNSKAVSAMFEKGITGIVTRPIHYLEGQDLPKDIMRGVITKGNVMSRFFQVSHFRDLHPVSPEELEAIASKCTISDGASIFVYDTSLGAFSDCDYHWEKQEMCLPTFSENEFATLAKLAVEGFKKRLGSEVYGFKPKDLTPYKDRLAYELQVIRQMGFSSYFLLVSYVVNWCKENDVKVGPGRGSAAGSLLSYVLGITDVDPLRFNLIFERFLNPDRLDYPDIDLDFQSSKRQMVIDHLVEHFGRENVAGISNYSTIAASGALRDVGRVFGLLPHELSCAKLIPADTRLEEAVKEVPELSRFAKDNEDVFEQAVALQGQNRALGQHAAGIVVAGEPIVNRAVVETRKDTTVNWDKRSVEEWGLIKLDILGLATLDTLDIAQDLIEETTSEVIDYEAIPLDNKETLKLMGRGDTVGIFQFEKGGARKLLRDLSCGSAISFDDAVAVTALNRPGPLDAGLADKYIEIRQGIEMPTYPHPRTNDALKSTDGVLIYQEQLMQIARDMCGFTMAEADVLRKAVGKKDADLMASMKKQFMDGATTGYVQIELEDGQVKEVHALTKVSVEEVEDQVTILQAYENGYTIEGGL